MPVGFITNWYVSFFFFENKVFNGIVCSINNLTQGACTMSKVKVVLRPPLVGSLKSWALPVHALSVLKLCRSLRPTSTIIGHLAMLQLPHDCNTTLEEGR